MSKGLSSYSPADRPKVVARRVRNSKGKGQDGIGTLAALDFQRKYKGNLALADNLVSYPPEAKEQGK